MVTSLAGVGPENDCTGEVQLTRIRLRGQCYAYCGIGGIIFQKVQLGFEPGPYPVTVYSALKFRLQNRKQYGSLSPCNDHSLKENKI